MSGLDLNDIHKPKGLSKLGNKAWKTITDILKKDDMTYTGGCKSFYSPKEWKERGEQYGLTAELIVVYDGGSLMHYFDLDTAMESEYLFHTKMQEALEQIGVYAEPCTCWYAAIYAQ